MKIAVISLFILFLIDLGLLIYFKFNDKFTTLIQVGLIAILVTCVVGIWILSLVGFTMYPEDNFWLVLTLLNFK